MQRAKTESGKRIGRERGKSERGKEGKSERGAFPAGPMENPENTHCTHSSSVLVPACSCLYKMEASGISQAQHLPRGILPLFFYFFFYLFKMLALCRRLSVKDSRQLSSPEPSDPFSFSALSAPCTLYFSHLFLPPEGSRAHNNRTPHSSLVGLQNRKKERCFLFLCCFLQRTENSCFLSSPPLLRCSTLNRSLSCFVQLFSFYSAQLST